MMVWRRGLALILILSLLPAVLPGETNRKRIKEANRLYEEEKYDQALIKYQDALLSQPENQRIQFNVANTLYCKKKYEEALQEYQKVMGTEELELEQQSFFNLGNTLYRMGKLPESILAYQQALKLDPDDMDAKYNLEYVRRKLKDNTRKEPQSGEEGQPQEGEKRRDKPQDGEPESGEEREQSAEGEKKDLNELTKEEAERILNALKNDEKDIQKKRKMKAGGRVKIKKDW
jgi:Ca-activated chloride channel family protein